MELTKKEKVAIASFSGSVGLLILIVILFWYQSDESKDSNLNRLNTTGQTRAVTITTEASSSLSGGKESESARKDNNATLESQKTEIKEINNSGRGQQDQTGHPSGKETMKTPTPVVRIFAKPAELITLEKAQASYDRALSAMAETLKTNFPANPNVQKWAETGFHANLSDEFKTFFEENHKAGKKEELASALRVAYDLHTSLAHLNESCGKYMESEKHVIHAVSSKILSENINYSCSPDMILDILGVYANFEFAEFITDSWNDTYKFMAPINAELIRTLQNACLQVFKFRKNHEKFLEYLESVEFDESFVSFSSNTLNHSPLPI